MLSIILSNTAWQIVGKIVSAASTLLITLLIGKSLGPAGFGDFTKIFVFIGYFYTFADFGLNTIFVKLAKEKDTGNLFKVLLGLRLFLALFLTLFAITITFFLPYNAQSATGFSPIVKTGITIASLTIITQALFTTANAIFQKRLTYNFSALATVIGSVAMLAIACVLSATTKSLLPYVSIYVLGGMIFVAVSYLLIWQKQKLAILPSFSISKSKELLAVSWPIGIALALNLFYFRIDVFILANFRDSFEVGIYGLGYQFFQAALAVPIFFANALYPILIETFSKKSAEFKNLVKKWSAYLFLTSLALTGFLFLVSFFIPVLYDTRFAGSGTALRILATGMPFFFISALFWHVLIILGRQKLLIYIYAIGAIFNLCANLIFIPRYGYAAASASTVISEALILALLLVATKFAKGASTLTKQGAPN